MTTRKKKVIALALAALLAALICAALGVRWFVNSGRFRMMIETRAAKSLNANINMTSVRFSWPMRVEIRDLQISAPGREEAPLLVCPKLTVSSAIWNLINGHLESVVMVSPKFVIVTGEGGRSNIPSFPKGDTSGKGLSVGTIKIIDADLRLDSPEAKAELKGILATLRTRRTFSGPEKILILNIDAAKASVGPDGEKQMPIDLKLLMSKFVIRDKPPASEIEAEIHTNLSTELPYLALPDNIPVTLNFEFDYLPLRDSLENGTFSLSIPRTIQAYAYGSVKNLTSGAPVLGLNVSVPSLDIDAVDEYIEPLKRPNYEDMKLAGVIKVGGEMAGGVADPELSLRVNADKGLIEWKGFRIEEVNAEMPVSYMKGNLKFGPGTLGAARTLIPVGKKNLEMLSLSGRLSGDSSQATAEEFVCSLGGAGELSAGGSYEFETGRVHGKARIESSSIEKLLAFASPVINGLPEDLSVGGELGLDIGVDAELGSEIGKLGAEYRLALKSGAVALGESFAVEGLQAKLNGSAKTESPESPWKFSVGGDVGNFEVLVDTFYGDFSADKFPMSFSGQYAPKKKQISNAAASVDFGPIGRIEARGGLRLASATEIDARISSKKFDLGKLFKKFAGDMLSEFVPELSDAEVDGVASASFDLNVRGNRLRAAGTLGLDDGRIGLAGGSFKMDSISADLPFDVHLPQDSPAGPVEFTGDDYGKIKVGRLRAGPVDVSALDWQVALKQNALRVKNRAPITVFGGTIDLGAVQGENVLGASATLRTSLTARDISLARATADLYLPKVEGALNADFDKITVTTEILTADGTAKMSAFGGTINLDSLQITKPLSSVRTIGADLEFRDIDLFTLTKVLDFGSISGIMEGTLDGLEISQGQPAAFVADFQTVPRRGVRQRINFAAVQNITILGTGRGLQAGVGRGLAMFFEDFGYDTIGFECTLKNDNFRMKGKVIRGDTEYFVKGVLIGPQINVINRNPGQTVGFKSMLERVNRIKTTEKSSIE